MIARAVMFCALVLFVAAFAVWSLLLVEMAAGSAL